MINRISLLVFFPAMFFLSLPLRAQQAQQAQQSGSGRSGGHYVIEQRYVQQLAWIADEYTLKYEVVIEQKKGDVYFAYMREFTEKPGYQISLPLGSYRYRVIPYDYLEQPGEASDWIILDIKPAPIIPVEVKSNEDGSYVIHPFENEQIIPGIDEIVIKNPDEQEITETPAAEKLINLYLSAGWAPVFPIHGRLQEIFGHKFYPVGAAIRFGLLFNKPEWFNPGLELSASWYSLNSVQDDDKIGIKTGVTGINFVAQKLFYDQKMAVTLKIGGAIAFQVGEINVEHYSYSTGGLMPQLNLEVSFLWFAIKKLYLETGISYTYLINKDNNSGCLRPWLGIGWKF